MKYPSVAVFALAALLAWCAGCAAHGKQAKPAAGPPEASPTPPPAVAGIAVDIVSEPEKASVTFRGKECGATPVRLEISNLGEVSGIGARQGDRDYVEKRVRFVSPDNIQVSFRFDERAAAMLKALGIAKALIFDYSDRAVFDVDKSDLKTDIQPALERQAQVLKEFFAGIPVYVCGHTDSTGRAQHNLKLSLERANAVSAFLESHGVPRNRMRDQGFGADYPLDTNDTPEGRALNRRTELVLPE